MAKFAIKIFRYGNYTRAWLNYMCKVYELELTEEKDADIILLSLSDPTEINLVFEARRGQKPIILGGSEAFHEKMYSNLVDLINVGEGFEIFSKLKLIKNESPGKIIEKLKDLPYIYYKGKEGVIYPSTKINWFIIAGYEPQESVEEFCNSFEQDTRYKNPKIEVKMTYLEPTLHTPLQDFDIRKMYPWDKNYLISTLTYASQRFRIWSMKRNCGGAYWRTCLHRARDREEIEEVYRWKGKSGEEILEEIKQTGWLHLYNQNNSTNIKFWYEVKR